MSNITVTMKDGSKRDFPHKGRPGGSYTKRLTFEGLFAVITDEYGNRTCIPVADIDQIDERPEYYGF